MKHANEVERIVRDLRHSADAGTHERILNRLLDVQQQHQRQPVGAPPALRRTLMKNPVTRWAAAAAFLVGVSLFIGLLTHTTTPAYGLNQTVEANQSLRYIHVRNFAPDHEDEPTEFWIACDEHGGIENVRYHLPAWTAPNDGERTIVWTQGVAENWFPKKNCLLIHRNDTIPDWVSSVARTIDPRDAVARLSEAEKQGQLILEIQQPADKSQPITVTANYLTNGVLNDRRDVLSVDQATKLVRTTRFEQRGPDGQYVVQRRQEYSDYDVPIAATMFTLDNEVPPGTMRVDQVTRNVGLAQGAMSSEEAAAETVRQFFQALIAQDYDKAGSMFGGIPAENIQQWFGRLKVVRIVSVGEPEPFPNPAVGGFVVSCEIQFQDDAGVIYNRQYPRIAVRPVDLEKQPDRWNIHGGMYIIRPDVRESQ
jgi:hypothetical protein